MTKRKRGKLQTDGESADEEEDEQDRETVEGVGVGGSWEYDLPELKERRKNACIVVFIIWLLSFCRLFLRSEG